jgi:hypothetical protein
VARYSIGIRFAPYRAPGIAVRQRRRLRVPRIVLAKDRAKELAERIVQRVQPDDRRCSEMAVVVPGPAGREHEVARPHGNALALNRGVGAFALDDESQCIGRVSVSGRDLAGLDDLQSAIDRAGDVAGARQSRVFQHEDAALGFLGGDEVDRKHERRAHVPVAPDRRNGGRSWPHARRALPERLGMEALEIARQAGEFGDGRCSCHWRYFAGG